MTNKSKNIAGFLGIVFGALGIHNFYLGYIGKAVAQLLITVLSFGFLGVISAIWGLIEGILILTGKIAKDAKGNPLGLITERDDSHHDANIAIQSPVPSLSHVSAMPTSSVTPAVDSEKRGEVMEYVKSSMISKIASLQPEDGIVIHAAANISLIQLNQAKKAFAKEIQQNETPILLYLQGKTEGFLLTESRFYYGLPPAGYSFKNKVGYVDLANIRSMGFVKSKTDGLPALSFDGKKPEVSVTTTNGRTIDTLNTIFYELLVSCFNGNADQIPDTSFAEREARSAARAATFNKLAKEIGKTAKGMGESIGKNF